MTVVYYLTADELATAVRYWLENEYDVDGKDLADAPVVVADPAAVAAGAPAARVTVGDDPRVG